MGRPLPDRQPSYNGLECGSQALGEGGYPVRRGQIDRNKDLISAVVSPQPGRHPLSAGLDLLEWCNPGMGRARRLAVISFVRKEEQGFCPPLGHWDRCKNITTGKCVTLRVPVGVDILAFYDKNTIKVVASRGLEPGVFKESRG